MSRMTDEVSYCEGCDTYYVSQCRCEDSCRATYSRLDDLCQKMLQLGAFADGTADMRASEIKERLLPFFGQEIIDRSVAAICGENREI